MITSTARQSLTRSGIVLAALVAVLAGFAWGLPLVSPPHAFTPPLPHAKPGMIDLLDKAR